MMMRKSLIQTNPKLKDIYYPEYGLVKRIKSMYANIDEWPNEFTDDISIIDEEIMLRYGERTVNKVGMLMSDWDFGGANKLARMIHARYGRKWNSLWDVQKASYNIIWNVDGTETTTETRNLSNIEGSSTTIDGTDNGESRVIGSVNSNGSVTKHVETAGTDTGTVGTTNNETIDGTSSSATTVKETGSHGSTNNETNNQTVSTYEPGVDATAYGHLAQKVETNGTVGATLSENSSNNSTTSVSGANHSTDQGSVNETRDLATSETVDDTTTSQTGTNENTTTTNNNTTTRTERLDSNHAETGTIKTEFVRGGNIGVTSTQNLLSQEIQLWDDVLSQFFEVIIRDIVDFCTYNVYNVNEDVRSSLPVGSYVSLITPTLTSGTPIATATVVSEGTTTYVQHINPTLTEGVEIATVTQEE